MSLVFRNGRTEDIPAAARLGAHSFPAVRSSLAEWEARFLDSPLGGIETLWVGEDAGELVAICQMYQFQQWIGGGRIPIMGLGTVAISPTHRRRGLAARLVESGFVESRRRGDVASALFPFRTAFYRRLGYGMAGEAQQFRIPPGALPDRAERKRVTLASSAAERADLARIYGRWAPSQTGQLERSARAWDRILEGDDRHVALYRDESGQPAGYVVFRYLTEVARGGRAVDVEEIVWIGREARLGLYAWLASLSDQWDFLHYRAHPDEGFAEHLGELRYPMEGIPRWHFWFAGAATLFGPMFRLLDLEAAWRRRNVALGDPLTLALQVGDDQIADNSGEWTLRFENGSIEVSRGAVGSADARLEIGVEALSRIYIGALSPTTAIAAGVARVDRPDAIGPLDALLALPRPWTFDRF